MSGRHWCECECCRGKVREREGWREKDKRRERDRRLQRQLTVRLSNRPQKRSHLVGAFGKTACRPHAQSEANEREENCGASKAMSRMRVIKMTQDRLKDEGDWHK